ncbi:hypothetical protein MHU86_12187 [Fragilaria crotonensis]|nr:hypothetical protein MHU86_12187 [Fragilaria crotonensis]
MSLPPSSPRADDDKRSDSTKVNRTRTVRKNEQEKRRRNEFKDSLNTLHKTLLQHDEVFQQESHKRETRLANKKDQDDSEHGIVGNQSLFNRVEIINQAAFTINRIMQENKALRAAIENSNQGTSNGNTDLQVLSQNSDMKSLVGFHEGVGPVLMVPGRENQHAAGTAPSSSALATSISSSTAHRFNQSLTPLASLSSIQPQHRRQALGEDLLLNPFRQHQDLPHVAGYPAARMPGNQQQDPAHLQLQSILSLRNAQSFFAAHRQPLVVPSPALSYPGLPTAAHLLQESHSLGNHGRSASAGILAIPQDPMMPVLPTGFPSLDSSLEHMHRATRTNLYDTVTEVTEDAPRRKRKRAK